jgi:peptidoglycan hydrolase CwlO-like protein
MGLRINNETGLGKPLIIVLVVLAVLAVGGVGYLMGSNAAEADAKAKYDQQVQGLQKELDEAKTEVGEDVQEGQEAVAEGQQTLESLQAENAELKNTIAAQNQKIADLEKQLQDANSTTPPPTQ